MGIRPVLAISGGILLAVAATPAVRSQQPTPQQAAPAEPRIEFSPTCVIVVSPQNDMFWAFSGKSGTWAPVQAVGPVRGSVKVVTGECVGIVQADRHAYGFSATAGTWDTLELQQTPSGAPVAKDDFGVISTPSRIHAFSASTARWATLDLQAERSRLRR